jgi:MFS family permease
MTSEPNGSEPPAAGGRRRRLLGPLAKPAFALLVGGQSISQLGDAAFRVALILYVVKITGSAADLGIVVAAFMVANLVTFALSGMVVDRLPRRVVMLSSDLVRTVFTTILAVMAATVVPPLAVVAALYAVFGVADGFFQPAYSAYIPEILNPAELTSANSANATARRAGLVIGPLIGAVLVETGGPPAAFGADAASFAVSVLSLFLIGSRYPVRSAAVSPAGPEPTADTEATQAAPEPPNTGLRALLDEALAGARYMWVIRWLGLLTLCGAFVNAGAAASMDVVLPFFTHARYGPHTPVLGVLYGVQSFGALLGAVAIGVFASKVRRPGITTQVLMVIMGASVVALSVLHAFVALILLSVSYGLAVEAVGVIAGTLMQLHVPGAILGRVAACDYLFSYSLMPACVCVIGVLLPHLHIDGSFALAGGVMVVAAAAPLLYGPLRRLSDKDTTAAIAARSGASLDPSAPNP